MVIVKALLAGLLVILLGLTAAAILLVGTVTGLLANSGVTGVGLSEEARQDIPQPFIDAYLAAGSLCPGLPAPVLAGIGKVESDHGRHGGSSVGPDGIIRPPIIGIPLDARPGVTLIRDTDNGRLDGDLGATVCRAGAAYPWLIPTFSALRPTFIMTIGFRACLALSSAPMKLSASRMPST